MPNSDNDVRDDSHVENASVDALKVDRASTAHRATVLADRTIGDSETKSRAQYHKDLGNAEQKNGRLEHRIRRQELARLTQEHGHRRVFFWWALAAITLVLITSGVMFSCYMAVKGDRIESAVMIAWLSTTLVETLGLGYIIAHSLFESKPSPNEKKRRNQ